MRKEETHLSDTEEAGYRGWLSQIGQTAGMGGLNKDWTHKSYDLRGLYKKYGPVDLRKAKIPEEFKKQDEGDLSAGPKETQDNWAKGSNDNIGSHDVAPWYAKQDGSQMGADAPWSS
jgi:hypothetical protein